MKVEQKGHTIVIKDTNYNVTSLIDKVTKDYSSYQNKNLIIDISQNKDISLKEIKLFSELAKTHKKNKKTLVIVVNDIDFNSVPQIITVVPSQLEAHDIIELEEIERDLGF
jgi:hypothetical protein